MGQLTFTATTAATQVLESIPSNKIARVSSFELANASTDIVIATLQRVFTPDASNGVASPAANNTQDICVLRAPASDTEKLGADDLADLKAFGRLQCICDAAITTCSVNVRYHLE